MAAGARKLEVGAVGSKVYKGDIKVYCHITLKDNSVHTHVLAIGHPGPGKKKCFLTAEHY